MRLMRGAVIVMTGLAIGGTLHQAAYGDDVGLVLVGLAISIFGIFTIALTQSETYK